MRKAATLGAVFLAALLFFGFRVGAAGIATNWVDPVARIQSQDEAVYAVSSRAMANGGDWLTPVFMGRYALHKPPLLYWLSASSLRLLGDSGFALRAPAVIAASGTITLVFLWVWRSSSLAAASAAAILLASSHLFFVLSRVAMTDALLLFEIVAALFVVHRDPKLRQKSSPYLFAAACGAAILTKAAAGTLPILITAFFWLAGSVRPPLRRLVQAGLLILAVALPWHLYQLWLHPHWFWREYFARELFAKGTGSPQQSTSESHLGFYATRILWLDPVLFLAACASIWRTRCRLLLGWVGIAIGAALLFRYRNASYLLPAYPALAMLTGLAIPRRFARAAVIGAIALVGIKLVMPAQVWGLPSNPEFVNASQHALDTYADLKRTGELIVVDPDDQFYAPLATRQRVRYLYLGNLATHDSDSLDFHALGIAVTGDEFGRLDRLLPLFRERLAAMDLRSTEPVATAIWVAQEAEILSIVEAHPSADFYLPAKWAEFGKDTHDRIDGSASRVFLLARLATPR